MTPLPDDADGGDGGNAEHDTLNIVVFGATGFIGGAVERTLLESGVGNVTGHSSSTCNLLSFDSTSRALDGVNRNTTMVMCAGAIKGQ